MSDLENLANRLAIVERQYRRIRMVFTICALFLGAALLMGQIPRFERLPPLQSTPVEPEAIQPRVRSQEFVLVDRTGKDRAALVSDEAGSAFLVLFDANGQTRMELSVSNYGPSLNFYDPSGKIRLVAGSTTVVGSHVASVAGVVEKTPASSLVLFDKDGKLLWRMP